MPKPATNNQFNKLRDWYSDAIGFMEANWYVHKLEQTGFTSKQASAEMTRIHALRANGQKRNAKPLDYTPPTDEELEKFKLKWCPF